MRQAKIHWRDPRLFINAGMRFPACHAQAKLLNLDKTAWMTTGDPACIECRTCQQLRTKAIGGVK